MSMLNILLLLTTTVEEAGGSSSAQNFIEHDPTGGGMAIIAMSIVFSSLILLYFVVNAISKYMTREKKGKTVSAEGQLDNTKDEPISGEVNAAIALALKMYREQLHDMESFKLTIERVSRTYSPWSSKIHGLTQTPVKKSR
jgi:Na+-transporting methylmalonyl-CoA/oxaloacetate decarboxylase gamma subunit